MKAIVHRDQLYRDVNYDPITTLLLNTQSLQRLGRVYQLGFAHLIFRGGNHTRLSHVMGVCHQADRIVDALYRNYQLVNGKADRQHFISPDEFLPGNNKELIDRWDILKHIVRWASLLHDIGHIPLGHTLEDEFDKIYIKHDSFLSPRIPYLWWEDDLESRSSEIRDVFTQKDNVQYFPDSIRKAQISGEKIYEAVMLTCLHKEKIDKENDTRTPFKEILDVSYERIEREFEKNNSNIQVKKSLEFIHHLRTIVPDKKTGQNPNSLFQPYMADIVGNTICADYLDYVQRDPANVGLDVLKDDRVLQSFYIGKDNNGSFRMALSLDDRKGKPRDSIINGVIELVRQRFRFADVIYYHKTKVAASAMLAKVFSLMGKPNEIGKSSEILSLTEIKEQTEKLRSSNFENELHKLKDRILPDHMLHVSIGDDSLLLWLLYKSYSELELQTQDINITSEKLSKTLLGISILQSLTARKLYKICFSLDANILRELGVGAKEHIVAKINDIKDKFRNPNSEHRLRLEAAMDGFGGWEVTKSEKDKFTKPQRVDGSYLLYVPDRKVQAKGIETAAFREGELITLGHHISLTAKMDDLSKDYENLWRFLIFAHPDIADNSLLLSPMVDLALKQLLHNINIPDETKVIKKACWFDYIAPRDREGARLFVLLTQKSIQKPNLKDYVEALETISYTGGSAEEKAYRAILITLKVPKDKIIRKYSKKENSLTKEVAEANVQLALGFSDEEGSSKIMAALRSIAEAIIGKS